MKSRHTMDLTTGSVTKKLIAFAFPLFLTNLLQQLYQSADNAVVGRFVGKSALAAVGSAGPATTLVLNMIIGFSIGASIVNANLLGAKKLKTLRKSMHTSIIMAAVGGVLVMLIGIAVARPLLRLMSCPENIIDGSLVYMRIILCGAPGTMLYNFGAGILRTHGDSKRPLLIMSISGLVNVVLNLVFVLGFRMTVDGVALATIISKYLSAAWVLCILFNKDDEYKLSVKELKFHSKECWNIVKVGLPCGINSTVFSISNVIVQSGVNTFGDIVIAGGVASNNITAIIYQVLAAMYSACVSFSGQCYGAGKFKRIDELLIKCCVICSVLVSLLSTVLTIYPEVFLRIFNTDPDVVAAGSGKIVIISWSYVLYGISEVVLGCLRGMRKTAWPTALNIFSICMIRLFWVWWICPMDPTNVFLLYYCYPVSYAFSVVTLGAYYLYIHQSIRQKAVQLS